LGFKPLPRSFYARPVLTVAKDVIGKVLVHRTPAGLLAARIVESEAYRGPEDRAAHSWGGRRTPRTEAMFGPPGFAYVFFVYGMHWHLNLVTTRADAPHAVLLVLDATVGQNALSQVEAFHRTAGVTGLVMTKLDGTARGGILVALAEKHQLPVHFIGVGEGVDDLAPFTARDFAQAIAGIES
jgi:hypothetical protein